MSRWVLVVSVVSLLFINVGLARGEPNMIAAGKKVKFEYTLTVDNKIVDSSQGKEPLEYTHGEAAIIKGLSRQMEGLKVGDERKVVVSAEEGYGPIDQKAIIEFPKANLPDSIIPQKGMVLRLQSDEGRALPALIEDIKEETIILNFNHPLAGQELVFDIKVVDVQ